MENAIRILPSVALACSLVLCPVKVAAQPLQPTGKWEVNYSSSACTAKRSYGEYVLAFQPAPLGMTSKYIVEGPGKAMRARQYPTTIELFDGSGSIKASSLIYPLKTAGRRGVMTILPVADAARVEKGGRLRIYSGHKAIRQTDGLPNAPRMLSLDLSLGSTVALSKALSTCMDDLRKHWGIVDGKLPAPAKIAQAKGDVRGIFSGDDYPEDALAANQSGTARFLLMIDEKGDVADCVVVESSGVATLDAMGCQVMRERAKFKPALDANGKPTRDTYVTPPIRWLLS